MLGRLSWGCSIWKAASVKGESWESLAVALHQLTGPPGKVLEGSQQTVDSCSTLSSGRWAPQTLIDWGHPIFIRELVEKRLGAFPPCRALTPKLQLPCWP